MYIYKISVMFHLVFTFSILLFLNNVSLVNGFQEILTYTSPNNCSNKQYFDLDIFKCIPCGSGFIKSNDGLSCKCPTSNRLFEMLGGITQQQCLQCKATEYVSQDQSVCVPRYCYNNTNGKISCNLCKKNQIMVTHNLNGSVLPTVQCITCASGTFPNTEKSFCQPCSLRIPKSTVRVCNCDPKLYTLMSDVCVPNQFVKNVTSVVFSKGGYRSMFYEKNWNLQSYLCSVQNTTACQIIANMCVMSLYKSGDDLPCNKWRSQKIQVSPVLMYGEDESYSVLLRKKIPVIYSLNENSEVNYINITAIGINIDGKVQDLSNMKSRWLIPCPSIWKMTEQNLFKFAVNYRFKCKIGAKQLISEVDTMFFEPYLRYNDKDKSSEPMLYTIPVFIRGRLIDFNKENDINMWQLVRRFYIFDKTSGITLEANGKEILKYFRYAKRIDVNIRIRRKGRDERNKIYPPLFIIEYDELNEDQMQSDEEVKLEFAINFELDGGSMIHGIEISVGTLSAFAVLYSILQSWSHSRRSGKLGLDLYTVLQFFIIISGNLANTFFVVAFGASTFSFIMYKSQKSVYAVPPSERDESVILSYIIVAFSLKIVEVVAVNWRQLTTDICFIDWEKPNLPVNEKTRGTNVKSDQPISFWRPYFVANEWNEIQTLRKINLPAHLVCCIFTLEIFGATSWTCIGVEVSDQSSNFLTSPVYQLAVGSLVFLILYFIQLSVGILVYERYIKNFIQDFMDICSISNVSILLLDAQLHGYYLHGRCVHASCDSDARGLQSGLPNRAFVVRCTPDFRLYYSRLSIHMNARGLKWEWQHHLAVGNEQLNINASTLTGIQGSNRGRSATKSSRKDDGDRHISEVVSVLPPSLERREQASRLINKFLTAFFDHALEDLDYEVREKRWIERLLDVELINESSNKTTLLYNVSGDPQSFQRTIWYGQEWTLATFDLYLFCFVQMISGNYVLAALVNAVVWKCLSMIRNFGGKKNLARKTLIDERFLV